MSPHSAAGASRGPNAADPAIEAQPSIDSLELLRGAVEIRIRHYGEEYRLRVTRQNKLILTK